MVNFGNLKKLNVPAKGTSKYTLSQLGGDVEPVLILACASESNKEYFNALLKQSAKLMQGSKAKQISAGLVKSNRDNDKILYATHILKGWEHIVDIDENSVEFNLENSIDFIKALPDWIFDEIREYASNVHNYIEMMDTEGVTKNS